MNISKINLNEAYFKTVYDILKENPRGFSNIPDVFNQMKITVFLDCDMASLYFIKHISSNIQILSEMICTPNDYSSMKINAITDSIDALIKVRNSVYEDGYVSKPQVFDNILPCSAYSYSVAATLSVEGIKSIFHNDVECALSMENDNMGNFIIPDTFDIESIEAICAYRLNNYVNIMVDKFIHDSPSCLNDMISKKYFSIMKKDTDLTRKIYLAEIYGSNCDINFFNVSPDELQQSLSEAHSSNDLTVTLCLRTSFKEFCTLICMDGVKLVGVDDRIKFINGGTDVSEFGEILASYSARMTEPVSRIKLNIPKLISSKSKADYRFGFMCLFNSQRINYVIDIPIKSIDQFEDYFKDTPLEESYKSTMNKINLIAEKYIK